MNIQSQPSYPRANRATTLATALKSTARFMLAERTPPTLREITRRNGVSVTAAYRHFTSLSDLLDSICIDGFSELSLALTLAGKDGAPRAYVAFASDNPDLFTLMFRPDQTEITGLQITGFRAAIADKLGGVSCWAFVHGFAALVVSGNITISEATKRVS